MATKTRQGFRVLSEEEVGDVGEVVECLEYINPEYAFRTGNDRPCKLQLRERSDGTVYLTVVKG